MIDLAASVEEQRTGQQTEIPGCVKTASDLRRYERLLHDVMPAWIIELGAYRGLAATWMANVAQCKVVSIDTHLQVDDDTRAHPLVSFITGNTIDPVIVEHVRALIGDDEPVIVICDSDHSAKHVLAEMHAYSQMVTVGSFLLIEDTIVKWIPEQLAVYGNSSPMDAVEAFLAEYPDEWENDETIEGMSPTTQHMGGFLRRVS